MKYQQLSNETQHRTLEGRLEQLELQHFTNAINLNTALAVMRANITNEQSAKSKEEAAIFKNTEMRLEAEILETRRQITALSVESVEAKQ